MIHCFRKKDLLDLRRKNEVEEEKAKELYGRLKACLDDVKKKEEDETKLDRKTRFVVNPRESSLMMIMCLGGTSEAEKTMHELTSILDQKEELDQKLENIIGIMLWEIEKRDQMAKKEMKLFVNIAKQFAEIELSPRSEPNGRKRPQEETATEAPKLKKSK